MIVVTIQRRFNPIHLIAESACDTDGPTAIDCEYSEFSSTVRVFTTAICTALSILEPSDFSSDRFL